jgi:Protease inhibitor Inh
MRMHRNRAAACVSLAGFGLAILVGSPSQAGAKTFSSAEAASGQWDMSLGADRTCRMTLEAGKAGGGFVDMPALCRRSLPILTKVGAWNLPKADDIELADASGKPILDFVARSESALSATGPEGETYHLVPVNAPGDFKFEPENMSDAPGFDVVQAAAPKPAESRPPKNAGPTPPAAPAASSLPAKSDMPPPKPAALALKAADVAGRYSVVREGGKDANCLLILDARAKAPGGTKASLAPACRDQGIMIFDPVGWRLADGRLVLTARRGFTTRLDLQPDGTWLKNPSEGKTLILKKL